MYQPVPVGEVADTESRLIKVSVDHGTPRIDLMGDIVFLTTVDAEALAALLDTCVETARAEQAADHA